MPVGVRAGLEKLLDGAVYLFNEAIISWMEGCGSRQQEPDQLSQVGPEGRGELRTAV